MPIFIIPYRIEVDNANLIDCQNRSSHALRFQVIDSMVNSLFSVSLISRFNYIIIAAAFNNRSVHNIHAYRSLITSNNRRVELNPWSDGRRRDPIVSPARGVWERKWVVCVLRTFNWCSTCAKYAKYIALPRGSTTFCPRAPLPPPPPTLYADNWYH